MRYTRFAGRAVAAGIGIAMAVAPGQAWADSGEDTDTSSSSAETSSSSTSSTSAPTGRVDLAADTVTGPRAAFQPVKLLTGLVGSRTSGTATTVTTSRTTVRSSGGALTSTFGSVATRRATDGSGGTRRPDTTPNKPVNRVTEQVSATGPTDPGPITKRSTQPGAVIPATATVVEEATERVTAAKETVRTGAMELLTTALTPILGPPPATPTDSAAPVLSTLLTWVRRETTGVFNNSAPTAAASQLTGTDLIPAAADGSVIGSLDAVDPDGQRLVYAVTEQPANGTVAIDDNGVYTYTPSAALAATGGADSFTVAVSDTSLGLGLFGTSKTTAVPVTVNVPAPGLELSRGFDVHNLTSKTLVITYAYINKPDGCACPGEGTQVQPGQSLHYELTTYAFDGNSALISLANVDDPAQHTIFAVNMNTSSVFVSADCSIGAKNCAANGTTVVLMDPPGTVVVVPADQAQQQADLLTKLCTDGSGAKCSFTATGTTGRYLGEWRIATKTTPVFNVTQNDIANGYHVSETVTVSDNIEVGASAGFKIAQVVAAEVNAKYGHSWATTSTYEQSMDMTVQPGYAGTYRVRDVLTTTTGDFTIVYGNTTYIIKDVSFTYGEGDPKKVHGIILAETIPTSEWSPDGPVNPPPGDQLDAIGV